MAQETNSTTVTQGTEEDRSEGVHFRVPPEWKKQLDIAVADRRTTLRALCIAAISSFTGIQAPEGIEVPSRG